MFSNISHMWKNTPGQNGSSGGSINFGNASSDGTFRPGSSHPSAAGVRPSSSQHIGDKSLQQQQHQHQHQQFDIASILGQTANGKQSFEEVCLFLLEAGEHDALQKYLLTQLSLSERGSMQRTMIASWLVEVFMSAMNETEDMITSRTSSTGAGASYRTGSDLELDVGVELHRYTEALDGLQAQFRNLVAKHKGDIDIKTAYEIIGGHGRQEELLYFATMADDYHFVLSYWIQREKWEEALNVLKKQTDPDVYYKYSSVLMIHVPTELVNILMRHINLDPQKLIPALLNYNKATSVPMNQNQAIRYLNFIIANHPNPSAAIHDTLISMYASHPSPSESALLKYFSSQPTLPPPYDADFALRLCIQHKRIQSCVHIYSAMGQYTQAVELALRNDDIELAASVADKPQGAADEKLRKKLWLLVAEKKIHQGGSGSGGGGKGEGGTDSTIKEAIAFLRRCELLRIEDLIPFFPDFVVVDDFKDEICTALEDYSKHIDMLRQDMDNSTRTADQIRAEIAGLSTRYAIVEPGEKCWVCNMPLLSRQFFVFPCQHAFHSDCLGKKVFDAAGMGKKKRIRDMQLEMQRLSSADGEKKDRIIKDLDTVIAEACILCGDYAIKLVDEPFVAADGDKNQWAL